MLSDKSDNNPLEVFQFLLAMGLDVNTIFTNGKSLLHYGVELVHMHEVIDLLLKQSQVDVNIVNPNTQQMPLFIACQKDNFYGASKLLEHGADYTSTDAYGKAAFDYIKDHDEWMDSGYFTDNIRARLKAYSLKYSRLLVHSITKKINSLDTRQ
jgi:ankyrin repeat protein